MNNKLAVVLNGGGARASYQVGVLRALYEIIKKDQNLFDIITGNSAGAINAVFLANSARDWGVATQYLVDIWKRLKPENVFDISQYTLSNIGVSWVKGSILGKTNIEHPLNGFLNTDPLKTFLSREIDFNELHHLIQEKYISSVALSTTNYYSGSNVIFYDGESNIQDWSKPDRFSIRAELNIDHVMGSSAIPLFFPPFKIGNSYYGDGCIRQITPLSPAIHLGATKLITIGIRHKRLLDSTRDLALKFNPPPSLSQVGGVVMNAIFLDSLDADIERLEKMNIMVAIMGKHSPWRQIPILSLNPSQDLGLMTQKLNDDMPKFLRYFLNRIGITGIHGLDLLSYLAFDSSYTQQVTELGYLDTIAKKNEILAFIDS